MQLEPGEYFGIVRQLADPNDGGTYYVRAIVRNARTDVLIDTVDLTVQSLQRYLAEWRVFAGGAAFQGLYITVTTYVYTDAAFTTLSDVYGAESETYLIESRARHLGGGGGPGISYDKIRDIFKTELAKFKVDAATAADIAKEVGALRGLLITGKDVQDIIQRAVEGIDIPEVPEVDLQPVLRAVREVRASVEAIDFKPEISISNEVDTGMVVDAVKGAVEGLPKIDAEDIAKRASDKVMALVRAGMEMVTSAVVGKIMEKPKEPVKTPFDGMNTAEMIQYALKNKK